MKKTFISIVALLLALLCVFSGCASHGKTLITADKNELSVNLFKLFLSRTIGALAADGFNVGNTSYWEEYVDENITRAQFYTNQVLEGLKHRAAALILYDEMDLEMSREEKEAIDAYIDELIAQDADGSKTAFESLLSPYGFNLTVFRDALIMESKIVQLKAELYGEDGARIGDEYKEKFYDEHYVRGKQILISNTYYDYERDADQNPKYYLLDKDGNLAGISYDTVNGVAEQEGNETVYRTFGPIAYDTENGVKSNERDEQGYCIYYKKDSQEIAYDTEKGKPATVMTDAGKITAEPELDENGQQVYRQWVVAYDTDPEKAGLNYVLDENNKMIEKKYKEEEMAHRLWWADKILTACREATTYADREAAFLYWAKRYSDATVDNGMYFLKGADYSTANTLQACATKLEALEIGALDVISSESGYHLLMRCELDDGAWGNTANSRWFTAMTSVMVESMLQSKLTEGKYLERVTVDEALLKTVDITKLSPNYYY